MIPKPGKNASLPSSYRPVTLLSTVSKVFESLLLPMLRPYLSPRAEQFGFREAHSTTLQVTRVLHHLSSALNKNERAVAVLLDIEKAFDRVWHEGLIYKILTATQCPARLVRILHSFLSNRSFHVSVSSAISQDHAVQAGVPQGSCLSPALYSAYTDDFPSPAQPTNHIVALYADDVAFVTASIWTSNAVIKAQRWLDELPAYFERWRITANAKKTQAIVFGGRTPSTHLTLAGEQIPWSSTVTYLGITIDRRLRFNSHVKQPDNDSSCLLQEASATRREREAAKKTSQLRKTLHVHPLRKRPRRPKTQLRYQKRHRKPPLHQKPAAPAQNPDERIAQWLTETDSADTLKNPPAETHLTEALKIEKDCKIDLYWLCFKAAFDETKKQFTENENIARLRRALIGRAREAVENLLQRQNRRCYEHIENQIRTTRLHSTRRNGKITSITTLGRQVSARAYGTGVRFSPQDEAEYRAVDRYLRRIQEGVEISWFSYSPEAERSVKVAVRGLPVNTEPEELILDGRAARPGV
ncbi:unnamed protein product [Colias eurytheme]|nr:unnamed protein product [Colias eurytheme]